MSALCAELGEDHARLKRALDQLMNAVESDDSPTIQHTWAGFEAGLGEHLEAEELYILPMLDKRYPDVAERVRLEHTLIRDCVNQLGVRVDLHTLRSGAARQLVDILRRHADWEDANLYPRAEEELGGQLGADAGYRIATYGTRH